MPIRLRPLDLATLDQTPVDAYALFVSDDERPLVGLSGLVDWRLAAGLSRQLQQGLLVGTDGEALLTTTGGLLPGRRIFAFGLGPVGNLTESGFQSAVARAATALQRAQVASLAVGLPEGLPASVAARLIATGFAALNGIEVSLFGPLAELASALPELATRKVG